MNNSTRVPKAGTPRRLLAGLLSAALLPLAGIASAADLAIAITPDDEASASGNREVTFAVVNHGSTPLGGVRAAASPGHVLMCDNQTVQGRHFDIGGTLAAGDQVLCLARPLRGSTQSMKLAAWGRTGAGTAVVTGSSHSFMGGVVTPDQGVVLLAAGSIHDDANGNGLLDAGETIDYHYTLVNLGTLGLSSLALTDITGSVGCPAATLAAGNHMVCSSSYTITPGDDADGLVINDAEVTGLDADGGPVQASDLVVRLDLDGGADLSVFKSPLLLDDADGSGHASAGDRLLYTFVTKNTGAQPLSAIDLVEPDPDLIDTPISCDATTLAGVVFSGLGTGQLPSLDAVLCSAEYTITADDAAAGIALNLVEAWGQPPIGLPLYATGASAVVIPTPAEVAIGKALVAEDGSLPGIAEPGELLTYEITLDNSGGSDALDFSVTDQLDANTSFVSADNGGIHAAGVVTWAGLTVPAGDSLVLTVQVTVDDPLPPGVTQIANLAYETGTTPPPCPPVSEQCVVTPTPGAVSIEKALVGESGTLPGVAEPGEVLTYEITLSNEGGSDVSGLGVTDQLDINTSFVSADNGGIHAAGVVTWTGLSVPAGGSLVLTVEVSVNSPLPIGTTQVANVAYETGTTPPPCPPAGGQCVVTPTPGTVTLAKSVEDENGNGVAEPGEQLTYAITLTNATDQPTGEIELIDELDPNTVFVSASHGGIHSGGTVTWTGLTVPANSQLVLTVIVDVVDPLPPGTDFIINLVHDGSGPPPNCSQSPQPDGCAVIPPGAGPQIAVSKIANTAVSQPGATVTWTVTVANVGTVDVAGVEIDDPVPDGVVDFQWTCQGDGGASCPQASGAGAIAELVPVLPVGGELVYVITAVLDDDPPEHVVNIVVVSPSDAVICVPEGTPAPCDADATIEIGGGVEPPGYHPVPVNNPWTLLMLGLLMLGIGVARTQRRSVGTGRR